MPGGDIPRVAILRRPMRKPSTALLLALSVTWCAVAPPAVPPAAATGVLEPLADPLAPPAAGGAARVDRLLAKLSTHRRLLVIGAHPDDEDTTLLAYVVQGLGGEAAYLSLSRGEGGQNLIGPELGVGLGLLRSRELLAARGVDGARQYFTRAYDFGYTRSIDETLDRWPLGVLLEDTVRVIRRFQPQVVVSVFPPDERAGHGQHQAAGMVAGDAYQAAGDPAAFPSAGGPPWRPAAFYRAAWFRPETATLTFPLGLLEPVSGRSIFQIAMESRSQHRCQDMGMLQPLGPFEGRLAWEAGGAGAEGDDVFAGVDTRLAAIAAVLPEGDPRRAAAERTLAEVEDLARGARAALSPAAPGEALPAALVIHRRLRGLLEELDGGAAPAAERAPAPGPVPDRRPLPEVAAFRSLLAEKVALAAELVAAAGGLGFDAHADRETLVAGSEVTVEAAAWNAAGAEVEGIEIGLDAPLGFAIEAVEPAEREGFAARFEGSGDRPEEGYHLDAFRVRVPADAAPTVPYFLERPLEGDLYDWSAAPPEVRGEPFGPPPLTARFRLRVGGEPIEIEREVVHRFRDQALGEVRRALRVVPELEVAVARDLLVWPIESSEPRAIEVTLTSHATRPLEGVVAAELSEGWPPVPPAPFSLPGEGAQEAVRLELSPPEPFAPGGYPVRVEARVAGPDAGGEEAAGSFGMALPLVDYEHVRATPQPVPAALRIAAADLELPPLDRVGYVRGASDRVPEALAEVGVPVELLTPEELAAGDLSRFDAIVVGARAYETDPELARANGRLLDYARRGGLVIVQYQQYQFSGGGFAPYPLEIARPHGRITDETAPVTVLDPESPVFTTPNRIGEADWLGWVQERGLYMPATWADDYSPLLEMADPGGEPLRGGLLVAPVGEGTWVYTGLAFFRQLPAGVPGAYRLLANLLALEGGGGPVADPAPEGR